MCNMRQGSRETPNVKKTVKEWFKDWVKGGSRTVFGGFYPIFEPLSIEHLPYEQRGMAQI